MPTGSFATLDIRVPNEMESANTIKVEVQVPPGFLDVSTEYMPGWTSKVLTSKLAKPVQTDDGEVTEQVREVIWTGDGKQGKIPPGQFLNFPISTVIPGKEGEVLTFKTLQYYDNGEVVRWIGGPDSEEPAPQIDVTAPGGVLQDVAGSETAPPAPAAAASAGGEAASSLELRRQRQQGPRHRGPGPRRARPARRRRGAGPLARPRGVRPMPAGDRRAPRLVLGALAACLLLAGCGTTYSGVSSEAAPPASDFPRPSGTLTDVFRAADGESQLVVLPTQEVFDRGTDRYGFGVFTAGKEQVTDAKVALYFAHGADGKAMGPYPARVESLATKPAFIAQTTGQDPAAAKVVYVTDSAPLAPRGSGACWRW